MKQNLAINERHYYRIDLHCRLITTIFLQIGSDSACLPISIGLWLKLAVILGSSVGSYHCRF